MKIMDKDRKHHIVIYYIMPSMIFLTLISLSFALAPPPVDQKMGVYDTLFANLSESKCRNCHTAGVPDRHHILASTGEYSCTNCHPVTTINGSQQITMVRNCMQCHDTVFNGMTIRRPHHETLDAQERHCSNCHGNLVDDYDDGHYIPTYNISMITPDTKYKVINSSTGKKWGGCESCHEANTTLDPMVYNNNKTHHRLGSLSGFSPPNNSKCAQCHDLHSGQFGSDSVRYCERCHAIKSLHNIQYDYPNTTGKRGSGHIGENWDCNGCHAYWNAGAIAPGTDVIIPNIDYLSTSKVYEANATIITIRGTNFVTTMDTTTFSSDLVITGGASPITVTPVSINSNEMVVTIPALNRGDYGLYALKNGNVKSNKVSLTVAPKVMVSLAKKSGTTVAITGSGFGVYDPVYKSLVNVTIKDRKGTITRTVNITSWTDTTVNVASSDTIVGDIVNVNSMYGSNSVKVTK